MSRVSTGVDNKNHKFFCCGSKNLGGRPPGADPKSERARKPWLAEGISQRTYYRRKLAALTPQHDAHLSAWRGLTSFARMDLRAAARRRRIEAALRKPFDLVAIDAIAARRTH